MFSIVFIQKTATLNFFKLVSHYSEFVLKQRLIIVDEKLTPEVNGCYLDMHRRMFKVRMLCYLNKNVSSVMIEDTNGNIKSLNIKSWQNMKLIPCCKTSSEIRHIS